MDKKMSLKTSRTEKIIGGKKRIIVTIDKDSSLSPKEDIKTSSIKADSLKTVRKPCSGCSRKKR